MQDNEKIELFGVARAFVQISENGPRSKKFGHPCIKGFQWNSQKFKLNYVTSLDPTDLPR